MKENKYQEALDRLNRDERYHQGNEKMILRELVDKHKRLVDYLKENSVHYSNGHYTVRDELWISDELMDWSEDENIK